MQAKMLQKVLQANMPTSALPQAAAPMELEQTTVKPSHLTPTLNPIRTAPKPKKVGDAKRPFGTKLSGVLKKKKSKESKIHKRQLVRATKGREMEL